MKNTALITLTLVAAATLAACGSVPKDNAQLDQARDSYRSLQADPRAQANGGAELKLASEAMSRANMAWNQEASVSQVNHLAYLASQRVAISRTTLDMKTAERMVANAAANRTQVQLDARTREAEAAQRSASDAEQATEVARSETAHAERNAVAAHSASVQAQRQTQMAMKRNLLLESRLQELNAKATARGLVITFEDVLFDVDRSTLIARGMHRVNQLATVLNEFPQRNALVEGFTDSTGSAVHNLVLSGERADAVRSALMSQGIAMARVSARGYGETSPVASNDNATGRQLNRRVEIVLSDDAGRLIAR